MGCGYPEIPAREGPMNIGDPRRTIFIEPIEEPVKEPLEEPLRLVPEPADPRRRIEPEPAR